MKLQGRRRGQSKERGRACAVKMMAPWASGSGTGPLGGYKLGGDGMAESESSLERVMKAVERELEESDPGYGEIGDGCDRFDSDTGGYVEKDYEKDEAGIEFSSRYSLRDS